MNNKTKEKQYEDPTVQIILFETEDVITTSGIGETEDGLNYNPDAWM